MIPYDAYIDTRLIDEQTRCRRGGRPLQRISRCSQSTTRYMYIPPLAEGWQ
jgi:hypothetical protein